MQELGVRAVEWKDGGLVLLDQRKLPEQECYIHCHNIDDVIDAIKTMVVRGAPAIGIAAAYGVVLSAVSHRSNDKTTWLEYLGADLLRLAAARPTAVNLMWAITQMKQQLIGVDQSDVCDRLLNKAHEILEQDIQDNFHMASLAINEFKAQCSSPFSVLTHCNTGSLATGGYGTALGAIREAWQHGLLDGVYADETRPWLQGARLTAWELMKDGIPVTLNVEGAAAWLMSTKNIRWVVVGADRITANGDVANKIGTYSLAILAKYHGVKVMVVAPSSTVDMALSSGQDISIEMRSAEELTQISSTTVAPAGVAAINPVFDVTPASLIDVIVTEKGVVREPCHGKMRELFGS